MTDNILTNTPPKRIGFVSTRFHGTDGVTLEARAVRGVVSSGMLCSGAELELDTDADGILELDPKLAVGTVLKVQVGKAKKIVDAEVVKANKKTVRVKLPDGKIIVRRYGLVEVENS